MTAASAPLPVVNTVAALRWTVAGWRQAGHRVGLVPTMGALHDGHLSLIRLAARHSARIVTSVFVNPTQFAAAEDLATYPRDAAGDMAKLAAVGADLMYAPEVGEMYPDGFATTVSVGGLTAGLCGPFRPGHFDGVATIVTKLLTQGLPDVAVFGEKDYQQLAVIRRLARDLDLPVEIIAAPTVRESDGLAMSSRNAYLSPRERRIAVQLYAVLNEIGVQLGRDPAAVGAAVAAGTARLEAAGFDAIDYLTVCDAETLEPLQLLDRPARALVAVRLGRTRLIDNIPLPPFAA